MLTKRDLDEIRIRWEHVHNLQWIKRYGSEELTQLIFEDIPKLIDEVANGSNDSQRKTARRAGPGSGP